MKVKIIVLSLKLWVRLGSVFCASQMHVRVSELFFFFPIRNFLTFLPWTVFSCTVHGSHKLHFSATFSLKIGLCYSIFQFSVFSFIFQPYPNGPYISSQSWPHNPCTPFSHGKITLNFDSCVCFHFPSNFFLTLDSLFSYITSMFRSLR